MSLSPLSARVFFDTLPPLNEGAKTHSLLSRLHLAQGGCPGASISPRSHFAFLERYTEPPPKSQQLHKLSREKNWRETNRGEGVLTQCKQALYALLLCCSFPPEGSAFESGEEAVMNNSFFFARFPWVHWTSRTHTQNNERLQTVVPRIQGRHFFSLQTRGSLCNIITFMTTTNHIFCFSDRLLKLRILSIAPLVCLYVLFIFYSIENHRFL